MAVVLRWHGGDSEESQRAMVSETTGHGPRCRVCQRFFTPDPRQAGRQVLCGRPDCRREYKRGWREAKYAGNQQFAAGEKRRVSRWRRQHPGYWKPKPSEPGPAPPATAAEVAGVAERLVRLDLTLTGYISQVTRQRRREELEPILSRCLERGLEVRTAPPG